MKSRLQEAQCTEMHRNGPGTNLHICRGRSWDHFYTIIHLQKAHWQAEYLEARPLAISSSCMLPRLTASASELIYRI